ncbi:MAG: hypothetical protein IKX24_08350 [Prevotella sp.]|nr:hypothetical protein [Prevotella sp.]
MKRQQDILTLTERFFDGETTVREERLLYQLYAEEQVPDQLLVYREMMLGFQKMGKTRLKKSSIFHLPSFKILSAAACLLAILAWGAWQHFSMGDECVAYVYGERVTDEEVVMQEMQLAISTLSDDEASETVETQLKDLFE